METAALLRLPNILNEAHNFLDTSRLRRIAYPSKQGYCTLTRPSK
jgi:hypothetical protein